MNVQSRKARSRPFEPGLGRLMNVSDILERMPEINKDVNYSEVMWSVVKIVLSVAAVVVMLLKNLMLLKNGIVLYIIV